jgi:hypothetical protein
VLCEKVTFRGGFEGRFRGGRDAHGSKTRIAINWPKIIQKLFEGQPEFTYGFNLFWHRQANSKYIVSHRQPNAHTFTVVSFAPSGLVLALGVFAAKSGWGLWKQRIKIRPIFFFSLSSDAFLTICFRMCCFCCVLIIRLL